MTDAALAEFCRREHPRVVGLLSLYVGDRHVAEELAQETVVRVIEKWPTVQQLDAPSAWVHRVAINLANSSYRRRQAERRANARLGAQPPPAGGPPDTADALAVRRAVAQLPKSERAVLVLRFFADMSVHDVSALLGMPEGTVKTTTARAIARLRAGGLADFQEVTSDGR